MLSNEGEKLTRVLVCTPREQYFRWTDGGAHNIHESPDPARTKSQHDALKLALRRSGCEVVDVPELPEHPNSVFVRDAALCMPTGFIRLRMGLASRRGEEGWLADILGSLGEPCAGQIEEPGTVEGGDVILAGAGNVICLGSNEVVADSSGCGDTIRELERSGVKVHALNLSEFRKGAGGPSCLILPVERTVELIPRA
jgi:dimethylargininase